MKILFSLLFALCSGVLVYAQDAKIISNFAGAPDNSAAQAKATLQAHGGEKLVGIKTLVVRGSAELSTNVSAQKIPAAFATTFAGEKFRFDIQSPFFNFKQVFDGENNYSSIGNFGVPLDKTGLNLLPKIDTSGYTVSALPEKLKKKKGFRITSPEGYYTDFVVDEKTSQVKDYESSYLVGGATLTTSVSIDKYREVEGVFISERFSQRLETPQGSFYADFKAKDILVNTELGEDVFAIPAQ